MTLTDWQGRSGCCTLILHCFAFNRRPLRPKANFIGRQAGPGQPKQEPAAFALIKRGGQGGVKAPTFHFSGVTVDQGPEASPARGWLPERVCDRGWLPSGHPLASRSASVRGPSPYYLGGAGRWRSLTQVRRLLEASGGWRDTVAAPWYCSLATCVTTGAHGSGGKQVTRLAARSAC